MKYKLIPIILISSSLVNDQCWSANSVGNSQVMALKSNGSIWTWAVNRYEQLGIRNTVDQNKPVQVGLDKNFKSIETGISSHFTKRKEVSLSTRGKYFK